MGMTHQNFCSARACPGPRPTLSSHRRCAKDGRHAFGVTRGRMGYGARRSGLRSSDAASLQSCAANAHPGSGASLRAFRPGLDLGPCDQSRRDPGSSPGRDVSSLTSFLVFNPLLTQMFRARNKSLGTQSHPTAVPDLIRDLSVNTKRPRRGGRGCAGADAPLAVPDLIRDLSIPRAQTECCLGGPQ